MHKSCFLLILLMDEIPFPTTWGCMKNPINNGDNLIILGGAGFRHCWGHQGPIISKKGSHVILRQIAESCQNSVENIEVILLVKQRWRKHRNAQILQSYNLSSRELTYPTWGKGKSSSKVHFGRDMLVSRRVSSLQDVEDYVVRLCSSYSSNDRVFEFVWCCFPHGASKISLQQGSLH